VGSEERELPTDPTQSKTLCMRGNSLHENREIPQAPAPDGGAGRPVKAEGRTTGVNACGKSDDRVVPEKRPNKGDRQSSAEVVEGRRSAKGNVRQSATPRTQCRAGVSIGLVGVREAARRDKRARFTALLHHVTGERLRDSFYALKREAAPGVDGVTWKQYEEGLEERLRALHGKVHRGTYRAQPSRRTYIPKADGRQRPLGIAALEDKIVQKALVTVLEAIYEEDFLGFSYGFRPGRSQHNALDALSVGIYRKKVNWVLDADIRGFFDTIDHGWLLKFLEHRIADPRVLRLIRKWLRAGVSEEGTWSETTVGTPQGAVVSPLLANVCLHYVLDLWAEQWRRKYATGDVVIVRYADDFVMGFQHRTEAERFLKELRERMQKFGLELHPDKTRLIEFGRYAAERRKERGEGKPETFNFLGFTHSCGQTRKGHFAVRRTTMAKRLRAKLHAVKADLQRRRQEPIAQQGAWLGAVVRGYFNYHAIPGNIEALGQFRTQVERHWIRSLRRRSQKADMPWSRFKPIATRWLPRACILHPHPEPRFDAKHPR
jgi:RNA-directed DNA polymerase